jgi:hypothetical protein
MRVEKPVQPRSCSGKLHDGELWSAEQYIIVNHKTRIRRKLGRPHMKMGSATAAPHLLKRHKEVRRSRTNPKGS